MVKVRDGQVANRPFYAAIGVTVEGRKDVLGLWAGTSGQGEGAKYWLAVLTELKNRGVADTMFVVCDGLKGLPQVVEATWPDAIVQTCVIHLLRNSFRLTSRKYWDAIAKELKQVYTAPSVEAARTGFEEFAKSWGDRYPALIRLWENAWEQFTPFLAYDVEIRRILFSTNAIVILRQSCGVFDVVEGVNRSLILRAGRAYLQPSSRLGLGRFVVRNTSGGVRLSA